MSKDGKERKVLLTASQRLGLKLAYEKLQRIQAESQARFNEATAQLSIMLRSIADELELPEEEREQWILTEARDAFVFRPKEEDKTETPEGEEKK